MSSRKRRAPGASPQVPVQNYQQDGNVSTDQYMNWNDSGLPADLNAFNDSSLYDGYSGNVGGGHSRVVSLDGLNDPVDLNLNPGQLVRRNPNQQIATRRPWDAFDNQNQQPSWENAEDDDQLEQKAIIAKKDALAKRKQIPPFVQKLSSFLDDNKNENLIRWSDDGNSFIVLDEDEFARTLIPELFKHNNYASFVRQLNMYGFHKKVGLSDNSMKASETKAKAPSEYYNKYFKRGRPELLWLIQKPKNPTSGPKRKRDEENKGDSDEERKYVQDTGGGYAEDLAVRGNEPMAMIPRSEYNSLRNEVRQLQQQQKLISNVLGQIKRQNEELYQRATSFQTLHDRHENSINAILTFLATFYNRSLESNNGGMNIADMFNSAMHAQQSHGNVVDVGDYPEKSISKSPALQRNRRPLALLPAPVVTTDSLSPTNRATTVSPTIKAATSPIPRPASTPDMFKSPPTRAQSSLPSRPPTVQPKVESTGTTPMPLPENDDIMSAIHNVNANAGQSTSQASQFDFPAALSNYQTQNGNVPLTQQQRNDVLSLMANNTSAASPNSVFARNSNNALVTPQPPPVPDLSQLQETQHQLELLQKMSDEQNTRVQSLQERLQPLSPSGQIPGLTDDSYFGTASALGDPGAYDLDLDSFVQDQDFFPNTTTATGNGATVPDTVLPDFNYGITTATPDLNGGVPTFDVTGAHNFNFDGTSDVKLNVGGDGDRFESLSSSSTSPTATVEEVEDETRAKKATSAKRRKT